MKTTKLEKGALTVVVKGSHGNDPSASNPVHVRMGQTIRPVTAAMSAFKNAGTNWRTKKTKKQKKDAYGSDSPMIADIARMRFVLLRWITQDAMWDAVIKRDHGVMVNFISVAKEIISMVERSKR